MTEANVNAASLLVTGPVRIPKVSWFEFILDETLLKKHLSQNIPDPTACQLITDFIHQARQQTSHLELLKLKSFEYLTDITNDDRENEKLTNRENVKIKCLKCLALKVAAFLQWDLNNLENGLSADILQFLLRELLDITNQSHVPDVRTSLVEIEQLTDEAAFSLLLYHRWCLRFIVSHSFSVKPTINTGFVSVLDNGSSRGTVDGLATVSYSEIIQHQSVSVETLERFLKCDRKRRVPVMDSIGTASERDCTFTHRWDCGRTLTAEELHFVTAFDLGAFYFFQENYRKALDMFSLVTKLRKTIAKCTAKCIDESKLKGYYSASLSVLNVDTQRDTVSLRSKAELSKRKGFENICNILLCDNERGELPLEYRDEIKESLSSCYPENKDLLFRVHFLNTISKIFHGNVVLGALDYDVSVYERNCDFVQQTLERSFQKCFSTEKMSLLFYISQIIYWLPKSSEISQTLNRIYLSLSQENKHNLRDNSSLISGLISEPLPMSNKLNDDVHLIESRLIRSYDSNEIKRLTSDLCEKFGRQPFQIINLNHKWKLSRDVRSALDNLPSSPLQASISILIAKSQLCSDMKLYSQSLDLLQSADTMVKDSYKLSRHLRWLMTRVEMLRSIQDSTLNFSLTRDLSKRAKTCLTSLRLGQEAQPTAEVVEQSVVFLVDTREWDYLSSLDNSQNVYIEMARMIASTCRDLHQLKIARKPARDLWESIAKDLNEPSVIQTTNRNAPMRPGSRESPRNVCFTPHLFLSFIKKLEEPVALSLVISCLAGLYNYTRDDISTIVFNEYSSLWPITVNSGHLSDENVIGCILREALHHGLSKHPAQTAWLRMQADIFSADENYAAAMKCYIQMGVAATDFFCDPLNPGLYDDLVYRRMIRCCSQLRCHTQMAVLCQFLDEIDYLLCFKALQERQTYDAMDAYYEFIWDVSILEYLVYLHTKRGELGKKQVAIRALMAPDLNSNNPDDILIQAVSSRKRRFFQSLAKHYL